MEQTAKGLDEQLISTQEAFVDADCCGDQSGADAHLRHLAELYDLRAHLPLQPSGQ